MEPRIERVEPGPGGGCNTWLIGDGSEVIVIDPGRHPEAVLAAAGDREILAVICTHGHPGHVAAAPEVATRDGAPVALHPKDLLPWRETHHGQEPEIEMETAGIFEVAGVTLEVIHTPGHSPGSVSLYCEGLDVVFTGDALTAEGPVPHSGEFPDFASQLSAIGTELLTLPGGTRVLPGHGRELTVAVAGKQFDSWASAGPRVPDAGRAAGQDRASAGDPGVPPPADGLPFPGTGGGSLFPGIVPEPPGPAG